MQLWYSLLSMTWLPPPNSSTVMSHGPPAISAAVPVPGLRLLIAQALGKTPLRSACSRRCCTRRDFRSSLCGHRPRPRQRRALRIVKDETILSTEQLIHFHRSAQSVETKFTDTELRQQLWTARRVLAGVIEPHKAGSRLLHSCAVRLRFYGRGCNEGSHHLGGLSTQGR